MQPAVPFGARARGPCILAEYLKFSEFGGAIKPLGISAPKRMPDCGKFAVLMNRCGVKSRYEISTPWDK